MNTLSSLPTSALPPNNHSMEWISSRLLEQVKSTFTAAEVNQLGQPPIATETQAGKNKALEGLATDNLIAKENALGPEHADTLAAMHTLGLVQSETSSAARAEQTWRKMLSIRERDPPHSTLAVRSNLGFALVMPGNYAEAEEIARQLLPMLQERHGRDSPQALGTLKQLIQAVGAQRRDEEAKRLSEQGFALIGNMGKGKFKEYQQEELEAMQQAAAGLEK